LSIFANDLPVIYLITDGTLTDQNFNERSSQTINIIRQAINSGIPLVQIREKRLSGRHVFSLAQQSTDLAKGSKTRVIVNDRADIAAASGADGVQLTEESLPVLVIRSSFSRLLIGASTHSMESVQAAANAEADFAVFGPVFETPGKESFQGLDKLRTACEAAGEMPVIAIGGIDETNYLEVLATGARGFAAIRFLNDARNLSKIKEMLESLT
jgi:thiamine-phosphate pyrophosphorylase